ncbi:uncharacterized protein LOC117177439 [Belonocnema kinseyi]|uniref:uncharacterized protein LOC117177439 n=1 Tax=Belonocnema kinseyi TaxID=2817044 RepID=UPI00143CC86E|nr:uncharacterized protein LOC117177439 [Belonocnema kinseyi]
MKIGFCTLPFTLAIFFNYIELSSQNYERLSGQVHEPRGGPSTSRRSGENESSYENRQCIPQNEAEVQPKTKLSGAQIVPDNIFYEKDGIFFPLDIFIAATKHHFTYGRVENGYVRPIYNKNRKMVIIDCIQKSVHEITAQEAEKMGINKPIPAAPIKPYEVPKNNIGNIRRRNKLIPN